MINSFISWTIGEGKIGYIRYSVNVILDIPIWPDKTFEEPFTVIKAVDLNSVPAYRVTLLNFYIDNS